MTFSLLWLPRILKDAGLKVALVDGWESRGRREMGPVKGVICHYTAGQRKGNMPSMDTLIRGREASEDAEALPGPLAQLGLGRDGTFYVIAAGLANHAGLGSWKGITTGNSNFIGIEAENTGGHDDSPWPAVQVDAYQRGVAAVLKQVGRGAEFCCGHKEYAPTRKQDPDLDMNEFRTAVAAILAGTAPAPTVIPVAEPPRADGTAGRLTLRRGMVNPQVREIQLKLHITPMSDNFGPLTEAAVRDLQRARNIVPDGIVGPKTWAALDELT